MVNVIKEEGERLVELLNSKTSVEASFILWDHKYVIPDNTDILVNATPIGFVNKEEKPNVEYESIKPEMVVCDVIPNTMSTRFLEEAKKLAAKHFMECRCLLIRALLHLNFGQGLSTG